MVDGKIVRPGIQQPRSDYYVPHSINVWIYSFYCRIDRLCGAISKQSKEYADPNLCTALEIALRVNSVDLLSKTCPMYHRSMSVKMRMVLCKELIGDVSWWKVNFSCRQVGSRHHVTERRRNLKNTAAVCFDVSSDVVKVGNNRWAMFSFRSFSKRWQVQR